MHSLTSTAADWLDWDSHADMTLAEVAMQLGIIDSSVESMRRRDPAFPPAISSTSSGPTARWSAAAIYDYQLASAERARRRRRPVPRLHPRAGAKAPTLLENVTLDYEWTDPHSLSDAHSTIPLRWIAHVIESTDGANPVVLAFRAEMTSFVLPDWELDAIERAGQGRVPANSTFVLPHDTFDSPTPRRRRAASPHTRRPPRDSTPLHLQRLDPQIRILDNGRYWRAHWSDLAAALPGFPLPWWPADFRRASWMRMWRPGDAPRTVTLRADRRPLPAPANFLEMSDEEVDAWSASNASRPSYAYLDNLVPQAHPAITITYADA